MKNKHNQYPLILRGEDFINAQKIIDRLYEIPRRGWADRNVENPETVGEHTDEVVMLSEKLFNIYRLSKMLKIHDWAESDIKVGDIRTDTFCPDNHRWTKQEKYIAELEAMKNICATLKSSGNGILQLWIEFEEQKTRRAKIARQIDRLQAIMKAIEYQREGQPVIAQEFIDYYGKEITQTTLKQILEKCISSLK